MLGRMLLWASERKRVERFLTQGRLTSPVVERFVAGARLDDAIEAIRRLNEDGIGGILDLLGEGVTDPAGAAQAFDEYLESIKRIDETGIDTTVAIKLTQLGLAFDKGQCIDYVRRLGAEAQAIGTYVEIDMEQSAYVDDTLDVYRLLKADFDDLRLAMQAYLRRTPVDLEAMSDLRPKVRLVKGAYAEPEEIALQKRKEIDNQFRFITEWLFDRGDDPGIATHDSRLILYARAAALERNLDRTSFEIQMLYGVRHDLQRELAREGHRVRCYVPFGSAWYPYLMRRLAERPANLRFFLRAVVGR
ncbi:MAG TPA: proline dehydrogenase family protein [Actinomycetota bacterium]|nr:proline dehydrogenase family protein [Actinomycetota bacterium]